MRDQPPSIVARSLISFVVVEDFYVREYLNEFSSSDIRYTSIIILYIRAKTNVLLFSKLDQCNSDLLPFQYRHFLWVRNGCWLLVSIFFMSSISLKWRLRTFEVGLLCCLDPFSLSSAFSCFLYPSRNNGIK